MMKYVSKKNEDSMRYLQLNGWYREKEGARGYRKKTRELVGSVKERGGSSWVHQKKKELVGTKKRGSSWVQLKQKKGSS